METKQCPRCYISARADARACEQCDYDFRGPTRARLLELLRVICDAEQFLPGYNPATLGEGDKQAVDVFSSTVAEVRRQVHDWSETEPAFDCAWVVLDKAYGNPPEIALSRQAALQFARSQASMRHGGAALVVEKEIGGVLLVLANGDEQFAIMSQRLLA